MCVTSCRNQFRLFLSEFILTRRVPFEKPIPTNSLRINHCVASRPLRARNPTPRRLRAARVWTIVRIGNIDIQPDLTGHKLEPVRSFHIPECCETNADYLMIELIARTARTRIQYGSARFVYHRSELVSSFRISECCETFTRLFDDTAYCNGGSVCVYRALSVLFPYPRAPQSVYVPVR